LIRRAQRWLFAPGPAEGLAALRIGLCSLLAVRLAGGPHVDVAGQPAALFRPRSFMHAFPAMPPRGLALAVQVAGLVAALLAAAGWRTRVTLPLAWGCGVLLGGMLTSMGKLVHNDVLLLLTLVPLLPAPVSDAWSLDRVRRAGSVPRTPSSLYGWPVRTAMVVVAGAYFFTALAKLLHAGPTWFLSDNLRWILYASSDAQAEPNPLVLFVADRPLLAHAVATGTILFELSFPVVLFRPRLAPLYAAGAVALHAGIFVAMGLDYWVHAATVVVVLIEWPRVAAAARPFAARRSIRSAGPVP
jgi:hypothetical protein